MYIETENLVLRRAEKRDFPFLLALEENDSVWIYEEESTLSKEEILQLFQKRLSSNTLEYDLIVTKKNGTPIGVGQMSESKPRAFSVELGLGILPVYWRQGFGTEILLALLQLSFINLHYKEVRVTCHADNLASRKLFVKLGFVFQKKIAGAIFWHNQFCDKLIFSINARKYRTLMQSISKKYNIR